MMAKAFDTLKLPKNNVQEFRIKMGGPILELDVKITGPKRFIDFDFNRWVNKAVYAGTEALGVQLSEALDTAISSNSWGWTSGSRDIVDTGALRASRQITVSGSKVEVSYSEPYAALVHYGGYIVPYGNQAAQPVYIPGRPWIEATINGGGPVPGIDYMEVYYRTLANGLK